MQALQVYRSEPLTVEQDGTVSLRFDVIRIPLKQPAEQRDFLLQQVRVFVSNTDVKLQCEIDRRCLFLVHNVSVWSGQKESSVLWPPNAAVKSGSGSASLIPAWRSVSLYFESSTNIT